MKTILIIEDEKKLQLTLKDILELHGYTVLAADSGDEGINIINSTPLDVILCDVNMPEKDGFEVLLELRNLYPFEQLPPFIFLTAKTDRADIRKGMSLGADDYITKPFIHSEVISAIEINIAKRKAIKNASSQKERFQISDELHNALQQLLIIARINLMEAEGQQREPNTNFENALETINMAITEIRKISSDLRESIVDTTIHHYLKTTEKYFQVLNSIDFQYKYQRIESLDKELEIMYCGWIQEFINNSLKHAFPSMIRVEIFPIEEGQLQINYQDKGQGFDPNTLTLGSGLLSIKKGISELGGELQISSMKNIGTDISITVPINEEPFLFLVESL